jgi:hypothetical protein
MVRASDSPLLGPGAMGLEKNKMNYSFFNTYRAPNSFIEGGWVDGKSVRLPVVGAGSNGS